MSAITPADECRPGDPHVPPMPKPPSGDLGLHARDHDVDPLDGSSPGHIHPIAQDLALRHGFPRGTTALVLARADGRLQLAPLVVHPTGPILGVLVEGRESPFEMMPGTGRLEVFPNVVADLDAGGFAQSAAVSRLLDDTMERLLQSRKSATADELGRWRSLVRALYEE